MLDNLSSNLGINFSKVKSRVNIIIFFIIFLWVIYSAKLIYSNFEYQEKSEDNKKAHKTLSLRKNIVDRNGSILATSLPINSIAINPQKILDRNDTIAKLIKIFPDLDKKKLTAQLSSNKKFVWIKRNITPKQEKQLNIAGIPALLFEKDYTRIYPYSNLTAFVTGYVDIDERGMSGIERSFNNELETNDEEANKDLQITIDIRIQNIIKETLQKHISERNADGGLAIFADITNGEILGMTSLPDFNPHNPSSYKPEELFNRVSLGVYELGSVFKPITVASAIDSHSINLRELFDSMPPLKIGKYSIGDFVTSRERYINAGTVLIKSSNIGTARIAMKMGIENQKRYIEKLGLFKDINIGINERGYPLWPKKWADINAVTISYGHGFAITPLHIVQALGGIMNDGLKCPIHLIKTNDDINCQEVVSEKTSKKMRNLLRQVVVQGSGKRAEIPGYCIGGKTGTSSKIHNGRYVKNESIASFIGVFPMYDPKYIIFVSIDNPKGGKFDTTGGAVSAPIAHDILEQIGPILNFTGEEERCFFE